MASLPAFVKEIALNGDGVARYGVCAEYRPLSNLHGIKFYRTRLRRDHTFDCQSIAYQHGLAPAIGSKFSFKRENKIYFGYYTENVELVMRDIVNSVGTDYWNQIYTWADECRQELYEKLNATGLHFRDLHNGNIGLIGNRLVAIDFSHFGQIGTGKHLILKNKEFV